ncbi:Spliceosome subunit [Plasmopara halstedii]|uniref:Spliceosome subunit n=1 Tax=Plasmopara halstedii TaxID=4781 RepID=A0A0P1B1J7_PLAHL|nr:Spliceosome subunit [Plasmopara halstedii]CEG48300.1 Spliceosome subunit [Plasmopara halstedii]|eukprot:XP_024584669.1 Spliceosome subunit [Plasmopara halstedii]
MDAQRALLDSLMGINRDGDRPNDDACTNFRHPKVCKLYLCGLCPRSLFQNTRLDSGPCEFLHLPTLRSAYEEERTKESFRYERDLISELSKLLADVEKKIARAQRRLTEDGGESQDKKQILQLTQDMQEAAAQAEQAAKDGDADQSLRSLENVELFKQKRREVLRQNNLGATNLVDSVNQKLRVCDVCGAFLSIFDSEKRLADHFGGKLHVGYVQIRRKLKELVEKMKEEKKGKMEQKKTSRSRSRRREERPRRQRQDRENRERTKERGRSRSRERRRSHNRDQDNNLKRSSVSSSRSRSRNNERKRHRSHRHRHRR